MSGTARADVVSLDLSFQGGVLGVVAVNFCMWVIIGLNQYASMFGRGGTLLI